MRGPSVSPSSTSVTSTTVKARKMSSPRKGKAASWLMVSGSASAVERDTTPRMPDQPMTKSADGGGMGSARPMAGMSTRGK